MKRGEREGTHTIFAGRALVEACRAVGLFFSVVGAVGSKQGDCPGPLAWGGGVLPSACLRSTHTCSPASRPASPLFIPVPAVPSFCGILVPRQLLPCGGLFVPTDKLPVKHGTGTGWGVSLLFWDVSCRLVTNLKGINISHGA